MTNLRKTLIYVFLLVMLAFGEVLLISFLSTYLSAKDTMSVIISFIVLVASLLTTAFFAIKLIRAIRDANKDAAPGNSTSEKKPTA